EAGKKGSGPITVAYTRDGSKLIVTSAKTGQIHIRDVKTGAITATFSEHAPLDRVMASPLPGGKVLSAGTEPVLLVWNDATGKAEARVTARGPAGTIKALQTDRAGKYALVEAGTKAAIIDLGEHKEILELDLPYEAFSS